jgi:hypothetical protein
MPTTTLVRPLTAINNLAIKIIAAPLALSLNHDPSFRKDDKGRVFGKVRVP